MKTLVATLILVALTGAANAQGYFGNPGDIGRWHGVMPHSGPWCPINLKNCQRPHDAAAPTYHRQKTGKKGMPQ